MNWITILIALGLGALWLIGLNEPDVQAWYNWLVFVAAGALFANGMLGLSPLKKKPL